MPVITPAYPCMKSSYNVSSSTLRVMMEQFRLGNRVCEEVELNKANWSALFEPSRFFEAYKNYLQVDIVAADDDDLLAWRGWVESCLRYLTLKIERDTEGCYSATLVQTSMLIHQSLVAIVHFSWAFRDSLGAKVQVGQQFDIRATVDEFKQEIISNYNIWKPGMDIFVYHARRKQLPTYVFPEGYKRQRSLRNNTQHSTKIPYGGAEGVSFPSPEKYFKRKQDAAMVGA